MAARSPASSPRLPSPPPIAEDQIGPTSPGVSLYDEEGDKFPGSHSINSGASRRIRPGTKAEDMAEGPPLVDLHDIDSAFQLTEHLKALYYSHTHPADSLSTQPITADIARQLAHPPPTVSQDIWLYELARFLIQKTNAIIVALFQDDPPCSPQTCQEMRASEWQYLCAVHDPPKSCAAIDYCCHTLDWAATTLTSSKMFPSRLGLGSGSGILASSDKVLLQQMKEIKNIFRRVYRIYAHAWFQHREMFWRVEAKTGLYVFFNIVCREYSIIENENYTIPPEAESLGPEPEEMRIDAVQAPQILRRDQDASPSSPNKAEDTFGVGDTTKRHRHTKSDFSRDPSAVIKEEAEEEEEQAQAQEQEEVQSPVKPQSLPQSILTDKPSLGRQGTALKDSSEPAQDPMEEVDVEDEAETPIENHAQLGQEPEEEETGILRSETVKPEKQEEQEQMEGREDNTLNAATTTGTDEAVPDEPTTEGDMDQQSSTEVSELTTSVELSQNEKPAAEAEEAPKTVGD